MFIAVAAALLAVVQADAPDLQCVLDRVPAATRSALLDEAISDNPTRPAADALISAVDFCRQQRSWDDNTAASMAVLAHSFIAGEQSRGRLDRAGLDPQLITGWFDAQTVAARTDMDITDATMERLLAHLRTAGVAETILDAQAETIGAFFAALVVIERLHEGLPVD